MTIAFPSTILTRPPRTHPAPREVGVPPHIEAIYLDGPTYRGKITRVFCYLGIPPKADHALPGVVLVHGGGGSAFWDWVDWWNQRGFAAIAMDTCGSNPNGLYGDANRPQHEHPGPRGWGRFDLTREPVEDQWPYHAVSAVVLAHTHLRSHPRVDPDRIGITGVSWGGYLTCIAASIDPRLRFAAPVYGCGNLRHDSVWQPEFDQLDPAITQRWLDLWDPAGYLPLMDRPMLWVNGTNDYAYPLSCYQKSYRQPTGERTLSIRLNMHHAHGGAGEKVDEIVAFARHHVLGDTPLPRITQLHVNGNDLVARYDGPVVRAEVLFTLDTGPWFNRKWLFCQADLDPAQRTATGPRFGTACFLNLYDHRALCVSSEHVEP